MAEHRCHELTTRTAFYFLLFPFHTSYLLSLTHTLSYKDIAFLSSISLSLTLTIIVPSHSVLLMSCMMN